jgi:uncharacterized paraquat-inducible protein A
MTQQAPGPYVFVASCQGDAYHQTSDCPALKQSCNRVPEASVRGHRDECKMCHSQEDIDKGGSGGESRRCPRCGDSFRSLGLHLQHCDGGDSDA